MKKRILMFIFVMFFLGSSVQAKTILVESLNKFSTKNPPSTYSVKILEPEILPSGSCLDVGTIISGDIVKVAQPKHGKRNGYLEFIPTEVCYKGKKQTLNEFNIKAQIIGYRPVDSKDVAFNVARKTINFVFKGVVSAIEFVHGAATADNGERVKTGLTEVYNDSFFACFEVGEELNIQQGDILVLKLKKIR